MEDKHERIFLKIFFETIEILNAEHQAQLKEAIDETMVQIAMACQLDECWDTHKSELLSVKDKLYHQFGIESEGK